MGMDVYGTEPKNEKGAYFRNNVWWWRPLWEYCEYVAPELTCTVENGYSNDGDGLDAEDSVLLAKALRQALRNGYTKVYEDARNEMLDTLPIRPCSHCGATGKRTWYTNPQGIHESIASLSYSIMEAVQNEIGSNGQLPHYTIVEKPEGWTEETKECNACGGTGGQQPIQKSYGFSIQNVREFATFLANCGGFSIC
jgi:hypothetical protein